MSMIDGLRGSGDGSSDAAQSVVDEPEPRAIHRLAIGLTYVAAAATAWNGWKVGGLRIGDVFIALALLVFVFADLGAPVPKLPGWVWQFGLVIVLVTAAHELIPTDPHYLASRLVVNGITAIPGGHEVEGNATVGLKFLVPVIFMPLMFGYARLHDARSTARSFFAFAVGSAISAAVGMSDLQHITHISQSLTGLEALGGRAPGLSQHPNFLAMTSVLALPIVLWRLLSDNRRTRFWALVLLVLLALGLYASGSRAGAAVGPGVALLSILIMPRYRRHLTSVLLVVFGSAAVLFVLKPSLGHALLKAERLGSSSDTAAGSDQLRAIIYAQGVRDFRHSPLDGVGMQVAEEAHNVYLQALAAGGILLLAGYLFYVLASVNRVVRIMKTDPLAYPLFASVVAGALFVIVQAALTDRVSYLAPALIATLPMAKAPAADDPRAMPDPAGRGSPPGLR